MAGFNNPNKMIDHLIENFDFNRVYLTMKALNWTWFRYNRVPEIEEMKQTARQLLENSVEGSIKSPPGTHQYPYFSETGGFKASCYCNKFRHITSLHLEFVVSDFDTDGDCLQ